MMVNATLLPFKDKIVYDGILQFYSIYFGSGIRGSIKTDYNEAKTKYGIVTSLPFNKKSIDRKFGDKEQLILYMKTAASRERHWYEIEELLDKDPKLWATYNYEWGRINTRSKKKTLKELGIKNYYFGIYRDVIIASGKTKQDVEKQAKKLLKKENQESIFYFKI